MYFVLSEDETYPRCRAWAYRARTRSRSEADSSYSAMNHFTITSDNLMLVKAWNIKLSY